MLSPLPLRSCRSSASKRRDRVSRHQNHRRPRRKGNERRQQSWEKLMTGCILALVGLLILGWSIVRHRNRRKCKEAVAASRQAIKLKPDDPEAWYNLGSTYAR